MQYLRRGMDNLPEWSEGLLGVLAPLSVSTALLDQAHLSRLSLSRPNDVRRCQIRSRTGSVYPRYETVQKAERVSSLRHLELSDYSWVLFSMGRYTFDQRVAESIDEIFLIADEICHCYRYWLM